MSKGWEVESKESSQNTEYSSLARQEGRHEREVRKLAGPAL